MSTGILYGIGVGPGAPDLLTLRAVKALAETDVILAASSAANDYSLALRIASPHVNKEARILKLGFPMSKDRAILQKAWSEAAAQTLKILAKGENAAFITLGDPLIYSTFAYLQREVKKLAPEAQIRIVPGITSFQAAAAKTGASLCEGAETFTLIPGILQEQKLARLLDNPDPAAILKVYRNHEAIKKALAKSGRACIQASFIEQPGEKIQSGAPEEKPPYMTLILCPGMEK